MKQFPKLLYKREEHLFTMSTINVPTGIEKVKARLQSSQGHASETFTDCVGEG